MTIDIVVVAYRTPEHLARCLASVPEQHRRATTVVENGSCEATASLLERRFPWALLIAPKTNLGFGQGVDTALQRSSSATALVLNADTELRPDTVEVLDEHLASHPSCAVVGPRIVGDDGRLQPSCFPWPSPSDYLLAELRVFDLLRRAGLGGARHVRLFDHTNARDVPWVLGCAFAIRRCAYDQINGFDPGFFLYFEEVDLCMRLRDAGWSTGFTPATEVRHTGGASTDLHRAPMKGAYYSSMYRWYRLYRPGQLRCLRLAVLVSLVGLRSKGVLTAMFGGAKGAQARADVRLWRNTTDVVRRWKDEDCDPERGTGHDAAGCPATAGARPGAASPPPGTEGARPGAASPPSGTEGARPGAASPPSRDPQQANPGSC